MDSLSEFLKAGEHHHDEHEGEEHHEESAYDEHIWLSLNNAQVCVNDIAAALSAVDSDNAQTYSDRANAYNTDLQLLDRSFHMMFDEKHQTMIFGDQFPFAYFAGDYGIDHFAAFSSCSADTEASFKTITQLAEKVDGNVAVLARTHILRFDDELLNGVVHSKEYFRQQMDDIDTYEDFCKAHPDFRNSYTTIASEHIRDTYKKLLDKREFSVEGGNHAE
jgi:zinc transport system substrate-binding protein